MHGEHHLTPRDFAQLNDADAEQDGDDDQRDHDGDHRFVDDDDKPDDRQAAQKVRDRAQQCQPALPHNVSIWRERRPGSVIGPPRCSD